MKKWKEIETARPAPKVQNVQSAMRTGAGTVAFLEL